MKSEMSFSLFPIFVEKKCCWRTMAQEIDKDEK